MYKPSILLILSFKISICIQIHDKNHYGKFGQLCGQSWMYIRKDGMGYDSDDYDNQEFESNDFDSDDFDSDNYKRCSEGDESDMDMSESEEDQDFQELSQDAGESEVDT